MRSNYVLAKICVLQEEREKQRQEREERRDRRQREMVCMKVICTFLQSHLQLICTLRDIAGSSLCV